tara:strand:- start:219 stop:1016 length:798 start_codon:yes stop_codon:yes gene_type:complete
MATINLGAIKFNWKGPYNNSTQYQVDDVVSSGGSSYICILASQGNAVSNGTYWQQMSAAGTNGTNGTDVGTVITTQGDMLYRDGSGLQRLAKGTASQELRMNSGATAPEWFTPAGAGLDCLYVVNTATTSVTANDHTKWVNWASPLKNDFGSAWNSTSGEFTIPTTGSYFVYCWMGSGHHSNSSRYRASEVYVDGSEPSEGSEGHLDSMTRQTSNSILDKGWQVSAGIVTLNANQVLSFYLWLNDEGASGDDHLRGARLSIMKVS